MAISNRLKKQFIWDVTIEPYAGDDEYNKPTYGTAKTYKAKIERQARYLLASDQVTIRSRRQIFLYTQDTTISNKDRLTLPSEFAPTQPQILDVRIAHDSKGVHHIVLET